MTTHYTPGPWTVTHNNHSEESQLGMMQGSSVRRSLCVQKAEMGPGPLICDEIHTEADAALIASAPELLKACKRAELELDLAIRSRVLGETWTSLQVALADAIAKAEGETQ